MNQAVVKAFSVLEQLLNHKRGRTLTELAADLDLAFSSANDIVTTLVSLGYVTRNKVTRRYALGLKLLNLGQMYLQEMELYTISVPLLSQMSRALEAVAAVYLFDPVDFKLLLVVEEGGAPHLRFGWQIGRQSIMHCSAPGKMILASLDEQHRDEILNAVGMPQHTPYTMVVRSDLESSLAEVRSRGFATDRQETFMGIGCLAVPIIAHGATIGSITIRVLDERLDATVFTQRALEVLASTAGAIANGITRMNYELNTMSTSSVMSTAQALRPRKQLHRKSKVALDSKVVAQNG